MRNRPVWRGRTLLCFPRIVLVILLVMAWSVPVAEAAPGQQQSNLAAGYQLPDWLSPETASRLAIGIDVLVPSYVPAPFGGEPEVQASDGYYSLYWLVPGAPPTYLRITGTADGEIPAFSYYDRNVQLEQNDAVMGYPAWHDDTPIYDLVYWQVGNVVYTVESHNMVGDTTMGVANSLISLVIPETGGETSAPSEGEASPTQIPENSVSVSRIGAPATVSSSALASIAVEGSGDVYLVASDGYFPASGDVGVVVSGGSTVDWQAPETDSDVEVTFGAYDLANDDQLASASTLVHGVAANANAEMPADLQCPATASASMEARIIVTGSGGLTLSSAAGSWPIETPNTDFQPTLDGGATISGGLGAGSTIALSWLAPDDPGIVTLSLTDGNGTEVDACSIQVVSERGAGDLGAPAPSRDGQASGDGTGISEGSYDTVLRVIANPIGFAGDASGGPEANGPDYGLQPDESNDEQAAQATRSPTRSTASSSARSLSESPDAKLGPAAGANGMYSITLGINGGTLASPLGATLRVPPKCLYDQTTVMIKPVDDNALPAHLGIRIVPGTAFDVSFGAADGQAIDDLASPASLTIALRSASPSENARIYRVDGNALKPMPVTASDAGSVSTEIDGFSRFVVGVPETTVAGSTSSISPYLIGGLGLIALASAGLLLSRGLSRRKPRMIPARKPSTNRVRYR